MAKITKVEVQKNNKQKVNIYLDGEYKARMYLDTCVKYGLHAGVEIEEDRLNELVLESEKVMALNLAVKYVSTALKTKKQIVDYLKKKEFQPEIIDYVVDKMLEYRYIDDMEYIRAYFNTYSNKFGISRLQYNLRSKGVSQKLIDEYMDSLEEEVDTLSTCIALLKKKAKNMDLNDIRNRQKVSRFLASRGFEFDDINHAMTEVTKER